MSSDTQKSLDGLFTAFYDAKVAEGMAPNTLISYRENYGAMCAFLESEGLPREVSSISVEFLRIFIAYMLNDKRKWDGHPHKADRNMTKGLSPVTVNTRLKGPRTMFRWLEEEGYIDGSPFHRIKKLKEPETNIRIMTVDELKLLLKAKGNIYSHSGG